MHTSDINPIAHPHLYLIVLHSLRTQNKMYNFAFIHELEFPLLIQ
jgi:hypothetical protein